MRIKLHLTLKKPSVLLWINEVTLTSDWRLPTEEIQKLQTLKITIITCITCIAGMNIQKSNGILETSRMYMFLPRAKLDQEWIVYDSTRVMAKVFSITLRKILPCIMYTEKNNSIFQFQEYREESIRRYWVLNYNYWLSCN